MEGDFLNPREREILIQRWVVGKTVATLVALVLMIAVGTPQCLRASETGREGTAGGFQASAVHPGSEADGGIDEDDGGDDDEDDGGGDEIDFRGDLLNQSIAPADTRFSPAKAERKLPLRCEGEFLGSIWAPNTYDHRWYTSNRLDLRGWGQIGAIHLAGRFKLDYQDIESSGKFRGDIRELYADYPVWSGRSRNINVALGKRMIYWGKGDEVRPIDRISPQDYTAFLFYDINERKTGRPGTFLNVRLSSKSRFEGFWSPYFEASQTPGLGAYFEPSGLRKPADGGIAIGGTDRPDRWSADAGVGGRFMFTLLRADIALYAFQGYDPNPTYKVNRLDPDPTFGLPIVARSISATHPRMTLYGADIERVVGPVVLRAEAAYQPDGALFAVNWPRDPALLLQNPSGVTEKRQLQYVFGIDKSDLLIRNLFVNVQFFGSHIFDHDSNMAVSRSQTGVTALLRYTFLDSNASLWYRMAALFESGDHRHHIEIARKLLPWAQVALGGILYEGKQDTHFGQYADRDMLYGKVKLIF
jgi:hypothetical protein